MHADSDLDSMINNLRDSAKESLVTYDEILHHTLEAARQLEVESKLGFLVILTQ